MITKYFKFICLSLLTVLLLPPTPVCAQRQQKSDSNPGSVFTNGFGDNWELSFGVEHLSFYSGREEGLGISMSPFENRRSNYGAAIMVGKWFTPEIGLRTKASGYWGKAVSYLRPEESNIRFFAVQEHILFNLTNLLMGYNSIRKWDVIPYAGGGIVRNVTHDETSIGAGFGLIGSYSLTSQLKIHLDLGMTFAGSETGEYTHGDDAGLSMMGKYRWISAELGLTFALGKTKWGDKVNRAREVMPVSPAENYDLSKLGRNKKADLEMVLSQTTPPEGMVLVNRGHLSMGINRQDSIWHFKTPQRDITVDDFWMDKTEITNRQYKEFIKDLCDSIIAQRMEDPYYGGSRERVVESLYITNPVTGEKKLDARQMIYVYEEYDYAASMSRKFRLDPKERTLNTDIKPSDDEIIMISKDTAYIDNSGNIIRETIERPLSGPYDFLNTYIVNVYPDTTCWVNDFPNADNEMYSRYYFSHPDYQDYPVVGVTWEQANAYCAWRTERMKKQPGYSPYTQRFRLPTEAEWEYAARGKQQNEFPWEQQKAGDGKGLFFANFMPDDGNFAKDGNVITSKVGTYRPNSNGLYDMAGNVAEWTSTHYTASGIEAMNNINPQLKYNASVEDPYRLKKKSVRGGSWKDSESHILSAWRTAEYQNQPRSYIGFRCVQSIASKPSEKTVIVISKKK